MERSDDDTVLRCVRCGRPATHYTVDGPDSELVCDRGHVYDGATGMWECQKEETERP